MTARQLRHAATFPWPTTPTPPRADLILGQALAWRDDAACAGADLAAFFPEKGGSTREAKRLCAQCPVRPQCLEWALSRAEPFGVLGGLSERERRNLRPARRAGHQSDSKDDLHREAARLRADGATYPQIAAALGMTWRGAQSAVRAAVAKGLTEVAA